MRQIGFLLLLVLVTNCDSKAQSVDEFHSFLSFFKTTVIPIDTRNYMQRKRGDNKILPDSLNLKYICKNDSDYLYYQLELFSDDTQELIFSGKKKYIIGAAECLINDDYTLITYQRKRQDDGKMYYLASFNKYGSLCDSLLVLSTNPEGEFSFWICSLILKDRILLYEYQLIHSENFKTNIKLYVYQLNRNNGEFILETKKYFKSRCTIEEINLKSEKCSNEDPFNKEI